MPTIYVIAGPPGIGKSTSGSDFIPSDIPILDPDLIVQRYREQGFMDYKDIGNMRFQDMLLLELVSNKDFSIELNLGFQSLYDLLKNIKAFNPENRIEVILFHTDDIDVCLARAEKRHKEGLHLVPPETVREMYHNTLPLLQENLHLINNLTAINVTKTDFSPEFKMRYDLDLSRVRRAEVLPQWIQKELTQFLNELTLKNTVKQSTVNFPKRISPKKSVGDAYK